MKLLVDFFEALICDVRVNLRGSNAGVTEHFLHAADVRAVA